MQLILKIIITLFVIIIASELGKRYPHFGGLIATMPITTLIILLWLNYETKTNYLILINFTKGVIFGIIPSIFFFIVLYICLVKQFDFYKSLFFAFTTWIIGAFIHNYFLK
jgi:hypothetical protein